ncbi:tyrosyl-tRNA synthetase [Tissierella praeacuta DSM 18095]|uniref:Tyrosine--tRNA ligase n=1 Tax=Tissierella praeacuta DSM 18095 TaxID=1123404 RepID=A0A1M4ULU4_9FIRM|nr:tyrosine--tRNA ligase [Tissierella praeacuta]TCU68920.1 tyrosyl-tRNA synthetase [Tissierella praeacuta]SHE57699.1 tyrosyl-tRNA synthetase [Tissierella praeacuta DSM 18095]SUP03555.1 Tyrosine--tRNA ligase [Tissierella praeacuta]
MQNVFDALMERGYIKQTTHEEEIRELLGKENVTFYIGFDPTADSLHVGHFIAMMFMAHMQRAGHRPIALVGGGTAMIGDPSGRTDMRKMLTKEDIAHNVNSIKKQLSKLIDFSEGKAILVDNADWLLDLNYVDFLREVGSHFSVNRMLTAECFKQRLEKGLSFLEFNYMLMQGYDFYVLNEKYNCKMQLGGDDQWSNMIAGMDLVRRKSSKQVYAMTCTLLTNSEGDKMGKTAKGALWLDPEKTSPYEFYQYWRNVDDADVDKCLRLLTFVPMDEVRKLNALEGAEINKAKEILAFEVTKLIHGEEEANKAQQAAKALFSGGIDEGSIPFTEMDKTVFEKGIGILDLLKDINLTKSNSEGRRLVEQGGITIDDIKVESIDKQVTLDDFKDGKIMIRKGKKVYHQVRI